MPQPKIPPSDRINTSYKQLASISPELHAAAKELSRTIDQLNDALEPLSLGVAAWATIASGEDENSGYYWSRSIGYAQIDQKWGIALRQASGNHLYDDHGEQVWPFSKAPRWMVVESIAKLPELFDSLIDRVQDTIQKLKARTEQTRELVAAINAAAAEISASRKKK